MFVYAHHASSLRIIWQELEILGKLAWALLTQIVHVFWSSIKSRNGQKLWGRVPVFVSISLPIQANYWREMWEKCPSTLAT